MKMRKWGAGRALVMGLLGIFAGVMAALCLGVHLPSIGELSGLLGQGHSGPGGLALLPFVPLAGRVTLEEAIEDLSENALTVRAQTVSPNDQGKLEWDLLFGEPPEQPDGLELTETILADFRPASDRRELNARGRYIPLAPPSERKANILPIEGYARIAENEMYQIRAAAGSSRERRLEMIGAKLPQRVKNIAISNYRRLELDGFEAWLRGQITQRNPQDATKTYTASLNFPAGLIQTASTAWSDNSVNAWNELMAWLRDGQSRIGDIGGVELRQPSLNAIRADAPTGIGGVARTLRELEQLIEDELGSEFAFVVNERTVDVFNDGGTQTTRTKVHTAQRIGAIPSDGMVGYAYFAPVIRAEDVEGVPDSLGVNEDIVGEEEIDERGNRVFYSRDNRGLELTADVQLNGMCMPGENRLWVMNAGV